MNLSMNMLWVLGVTIAGLLLYLFSNNKRSHVGLVMFFAGVFWLVYLLAVKGVVF